MATTGFWPVKANLLALIKYTENPEKTAADDFKALHDVIDYDMNGDKTEHRLYVTGINCLPETAYERMMATKRQFHKTDGVLAYHAYQSFKAGEVTPKECHRIGIETAKQMWGDRFEVTVSSHVNGEHLHNHFCVNSVSFVDGAKFKNKNAERFRLREISDKLCEKHRLSVLYGSHFYSNRNKRAYWKNKSASEIEKEIIRQDFLEATRFAVNEWQFCEYLKGLGYYINRNWKYEHISVTPPGWNKTVRVDTIVPELDRKGLKQTTFNNFVKLRRIPELEFDFCPLRRYNDPLWYYRYYHNNVREFVDAVFGIIRIAMGLDGYRERNPRPVITSPVFRKEYKALDESQAMIRFISKHQVKTPQDIRDAMAKCQTRIDDLKEEREILRNRIRRPKETDTVAELKAARDSLTRDITEAREQLKTATKLIDLLTRLEKEVNKEFEMEQNGTPLPEPLTADETSRYINREDYDPSKHKPQYESQVQERKRDGWER